MPRLSCSQPLSSSPDEQSVIGTNRCSIMRFYNPREHRYIPQQILSAQEEPRHDADGYQQQQQIYLSQPLRLPLQHPHQQKGRDTDWQLLLKHPTAVFTLCLFAFVIFLGLVGWVIERKMSRKRAAGAKGGEVGGYGGVENEEV